MGEIDAAFTSRDLLKFKLIRDVHLSPDAKELVYEVKIPDEEKDSYRTEVWRADIDGKNQQRFTQAPKGNDSHPRWSPDGENIAFISTRNGTPQAFIISRHGGEARQLTTLENGFGLFSWSPDGKALCGISEVTKEHPPKDMDKNSDRWKKRPRVVDHQRYKSDGTGYALGGSPQLFTVSLEGETKQLTDLSGDVASSWWSPDGKQIVYCQSRNGNADSHVSDLWVIEVETKKRRQLTDSYPSVQQPVWSPDGKWIVFGSAKDPGDGMQNLWLLHVDTNKIRPLGDSVDLEVSSFPLNRNRPPAWTEDSKEVIFSLSRKSVGEVVAVDIEYGKIRALIEGDRQATLMSYNRGVTAVVSESLLQPNELLTLKDGKETKAVDLNSDWWNKKSVPRYEKRRFKVPLQGEAEIEIDGWLLLPRDVLKKPIPIVVDVHGGPHSMAEFGFSYHVNWYCLTKRMGSSLT